MDFEPITSGRIARPDVQASPVIKGACEATVAMYEAAGSVSPWIGYLAIEDGAPVGACAFKTPPTAEGVEIAYFTFPGHEGRGVATRMARRLVEIAESQGVPMRAQTLPEKNASTRILEKLGFSFMGPVQHPEDGEVWEWRLRPKGG